MSERFSRWSVILVLIFAAGAASAQEVTNEVRHDTSPALSAIREPLAPESGRKVVRPIELIPTRIGGRAPIQLDPVEQTAPGTGTTPSMLVSFEGIGKGLGSFAVSSVPPDTTGAAGDTQFVQAVNTSLAVFSKAGGAPILGPVPIKRLWSGFGGACETQNDGDPVIRFDSLARRWVITQFQVHTGFSQCVAISTTTDATGSYHRYEFKYPAMNDYPKLGVWHDAYYITFNMFRGLSGARACAYERDKMLVGAAARQVCFQLSAAFWSLMPGDVDGRTAPPAGAANPMLSLGGDSRSLDLWRFHVDWANPALSTFGLGAAHTPNLNIPVSPFSDACGGGTCVPQQGVAQQLDSLGERLMMRAAYRRFTTHEAVVVTHNVRSTTAAAAVRWYEIRSITAAPVVAQQGTFSPDGSSRWMGSAAMDRMGNLLAGYSVSGTSVKPSIRAAGRAPGDPAGTLGPEVSVIAGTGTQTGASRWGDYSEMSVDPEDDCTLWFTTEFMRSSGTFAWSTRIASFRFPSCSGRDSSDPRRIVFVSTRDVNREIYSISADGSDLRRLTNNPASDFAPAVSPDGTSIVFVSDRDGTPNLYIMLIDGSDVRRVTNVPTTDDHPVWVVPPTPAEPRSALPRDAPPIGAGTAEVWGGSNAILRATPTGATIEFGCAAGQMDSPLPASGPFDIAGTYTAHRGGPIRADEPPETPRPARFTGSVDDGHATLAVRVANDVVAEAELTRGAVSRVVRCVSPG